MSVPDVVTFVDEDGRDLGWGELKLTPEQRLLIASLMLKWHQSFEVTFNRMLRCGLRSLRRKAVA